MGERTLLLEKDAIYKDMKVKRHLLLYLIILKKKFFLTQMT